MAADVLIGRKERMWQIRESGKLLILSPDIGIERLEDMRIKSRVRGRV